VACGELGLPQYLHYAFYLACSWLWCLGGFFPLILARDYGWPAIAAFTIFNIGGATAMGFYFKGRNQQATFEKRHRPAISLFSYITLAYQLFFVTWLGATIGQPYLLAVVLAIGMIIYLGKNHITYSAIALYFISIGLFISFLGSDFAPVEINTKNGWQHAFLPLAIGFILSPYLDITFHRAVKNSPRPKVTFAIGFGVLFLSLLCFVFIYAGSLGDVFFNQGVPAAIIYPVVAFLMLQTAFTIAAHASELTTQQYIKPASLAAVILILAGLSLGLIFLLRDALIPWLNLPIEETLYKSFLFFYSLVFPLYLIIGRSKGVYLLALAVCTPAYSIGFLIGASYTYTLSIGAAVIILFAVAKRLSLIQQDKASISD